MKNRKIKKMKTYIVVVSWVSDTDLLRSALSDVGEYVYLFDNVFLLKSSWKPTEIRNRLKNNFPINTSIFISKLVRGAAWSNVEASNMSIKAMYQDGKE
jgi:hypothetical protein